MNQRILPVIVGLLFVSGIDRCEASRPENADRLNIRSESQRRAPIGTPGLAATYRHENRETIPESVVRDLRIIFGEVEERNGKEYQWLSLHGTKANEQEFRVWLLSECYPPSALDEAQKTTVRYIVQVDEARPLEFRSRFTGEAVLPSLGGWAHLFPYPSIRAARANEFPRNVRYLGHRYLLESQHNVDPAIPPRDADVIDLLPDVLIGVPHNTKQKDETRRYDESDYELIGLTRSDYDEMIEAGMNCLRVDPEQATWIQRRNVFYWGVGGEQILYPECLYRSNYLGPSLFLDEPAVRTRDGRIRPRLAKDEEFRERITHQVVLDEFKDYFHEELYEGHPANLLEGLVARSDVDIGDMKFLQRNMYTWETMVASAAHQLSVEKNGPPAYIVFEPPGRFGTRRVLPEMNMAYGCQIPVDNPSNFISIIYGFLRGAARYTGKGWGTSIYGAVDRTDAFWFLTHAYDLGARGFFFWDSYQLACVPFHECLALARNLKGHIENHPHRDMDKLRHAAEVAILLPPGYNLGHVHMGRGNLWGLNELNLERENEYGITYRTVMSNFFTEIERCLRLGVSFDLLWDLSELQLAGYREIVRVREDGQVEIESGGRRVLRSGPRTPIRPEGVPPKLEVEISRPGDALPASIETCARLIETSAPVYYTRGADSKGVYNNVMVCWELFGPEEEDYRFLLQEIGKPTIYQEDNEITVEINFPIGQPGEYRLRAATADLAGRTSVVWKEFVVGN